MVDKNTIDINIHWRNAEVYEPTETDLAIMYCSGNGKIGTLKSISHLWNWYKEKYNIKWWVYQIEALPE